MKAKKIICERFDGFPKPENFAIVQEDLTDLKDGEILLEAKYLSVDAGSKVFMDMLPSKSQMVGAQVGVVLESKNQRFPVGSAVFAPLGWRNYTVRISNKSYIV
jgi:NADPH-dependent curcumin reductase CurA